MARQGSTESTSTDFESACESVLSTPHWQGNSSKRCASCLLHVTLPLSYCLQSLF